MNYLMRSVFLIVALFASMSAHSGRVNYPTGNTCNVPTGNGDNLLCPQYTQYSWKWVDIYGRVAIIKISGPNSVDIDWNGRFLGTFPAALNGKSYSGSNPYGTRWAVVNFQVNINGYNYYVGIKEFINYDNIDDVARVTVNGVEYEYRI